jgi:hypothetical protein
MCHRQIHALIPERELAREYASIEALLRHPGVARYVQWVRNKPADMRERTRKSAGGAGGWVEWVGRALRRLLHRQLDRIAKLCSHIHQRIKRELVSAPFDQVIHAGLGDAGALGGLCLRQAHLGNRLADMDNKVRTQQQILRLGLWKAQVAELRCRCRRRLSVFRSWPHLFQ